MDPDTSTLNRLRKGATSSRCRFLLATLCTVTALLTSAVIPAYASTLPVGFSEVEITRPDGAAVWNEAVGITFSASGRMFVWERTGSVWIVDPSSPVPQPFLNIADEVLAWSDHGMLGFALDPDFEQNGFVYVMYAVDPYHLTTCDSPVDGAPQCAAGYNPNTTWIPEDPTSPGYFKATIGRIVRYRAILPPGHSDYRHVAAVSYGSRKVLLGESLRAQPKANSFAILWITHGPGQLLFGRDGTLLASIGDGGKAGNSADIGSSAETYYQQALADGIILPKENVGAFRSQLIDSLSGKILRLDPATGNGIPSNPYYDPEAPRSARSRMWVRGLRNPYRMTLRPNTGSTSVAAANPGTLYVGDVGLHAWEDINIVTTPGQNFGWPIYEGMTTHSQYLAAAPTVFNRDAPNPLDGVAGCTQQFFSFADLLVQDTLNIPSFPNPCNGTQQIPASVHPAVHRRPAIDYRHDQAITRWSAFNTNGTARPQALGSAAPDGTVVTGTPFSGSTSIGGVWFRGTGFPASYLNTYLHADYSGQWIKRFLFDANNQPQAIEDFVSDAGGIVALGAHPEREGLFYIAWTAFVRHITYSPPGGRPPVVVARATPSFGAGPLTVNFNSVGSSDPDGGAITYSWDFGDRATSTSANPQHIFVAPSGAPASFDTTLTITDPTGLTAQRSLLISVNNTPPTAAITSPVNGSTYSVTEATSVELRATRSDTQTPAGDLLCQWQTVLYHNEHEHTDPFIGTCAAATTIAPIGCDGQRYAYGFRLRVTDPQGLTTADEVRLYPACSGIDSLPPSTPQSLRTTLVNTTRIDLRWDAATDAGGGSVAGYRVLRDGVAIATTTTTSYSDVGLSPGRPYGYAILAFDDAVPPNPSMPSSSITVQTASGGGTTAIRVNAGGPAFTDTLGRAWSADFGFNTGAIDTFKQPIANTTQDALYQTERRDPGAKPDLLYSFAVPNGSYEVRLHFAENASGITAAGQRVFDIDIEGVRRFEDIDIRAEAGWRTALIRNVTVNVNDGQLNILFRPQVEKPIINAIEIVGGDSPDDVTAPTVPTGLTANPLSSTQVRLTWNASSDSGTGVAGYRIRRDGQVVATTASTSYTDGGLTPNTAYTYSVSAFDGATPVNESLASPPRSATTPATPSGTTIRVNAGGPVFTDTLGRVWSADFGFNTGAIDSFKQPIADTAQDTLYQTERRDPGAKPDLLYSFAVPNGSYEVRLHFAENASGITAAGQRVFDIDIEGVRRFEDIDIRAEAGWRTALIRNVTVNVNDGQLNILFRPQVEKPIINAIEIVPQ